MDHWDDATPQSSAADAENPVIQWRIRIHLQVWLDIGIGRPKWLHKMLHISSPRVLELSTPVK